MKSVVRGLAGLLLILPSIVAAVPSEAEQRLSVLQEYDNRIETEPLWSKRISVSFDQRFIKLQPVQWGELVYSADWRGTLFAHRLENGELIWQQSFDEVISGGLSLRDDKLLFATSEGGVVAVDRLTGNTLWRTKLTSEILSQPMLADGRVVVHSNDGYIYGLLASSGERVWSYQYKVPALTLRGTSSPVYVDGMVLVGLDSGRLVALDIDSGNVRWEQAVAVPQGRSELERMVDVDATVVVDNSTVYVVSYQGRLAAMDLRSGRVLWLRDFSSYSGLTFDEQNLYLSDAEGNLFAINRSSGASIWKQTKLAGLALTQPLLSQQKLLMAADDGYLYWLSPNSGELLSRVSAKELSARLKGMEWDLWHDYDRSGQPNVYQQDVGINTAPQLLSDESLLVLDNQGYLTRFSH